MTNKPPDLVPQTAALFLRIVRRRQERDPPFDWFVAQWWGLPDEEIEEALRRDYLSFRDRRRLAFLYAERLFYTASEQSDVGQLRRACRAMIDGLYLVGRSHDESEEEQFASLSAALELCHSLRHPLRRAIAAALERMDAESYDLNRGLNLAVGFDWTEFVELKRDLQRSAYDPLATPTFEVEAPPSAADALASLAAQARTTVDAPQTYDTSDARRRVADVSLSGFRGAPVALSMDFLRSGKPVSAIVFGDNGVGKSTLVDGIEFALQGRIGRSVSFNGHLSPSAASFAVESSPTVEATLDDGSIVRRGLQERPDGSLHVAGDAPRPGFRLAPVTLKRQDILRFLDTDALARGHVFFDYFPTSAEKMAVRPEETLRLLEDEAYELRVVRQAFIGELASALDVSARLVDGRDALVKLVREQFLGGETIEEAQEKGSWAAMPDQVRSLVEQLLSVFARLKGIKTQQEKGVQTLNPIAYRTQAESIASVLNGVGGHLTEAFTRITGATHVQRIEVVFGGSGPVSLDVVLVLESGRRCFPQQIFSEGYRDLLAILFFAIMARRSAERGQAKVLILDDVFQSVDATVRASTVEYLLTEFADWQLILTAHDRLWFEQLRNVFNRHQHPYVERELRRWSFTGGPEASLPSDLTSALRRELEHGDASGVCGVAGRTLEQMSNHLSSRLGSSVIRKVGDKYTLGDLWPGVRKKLKGTRAEGPCARIDQLYALRNLAGAHYNEWAETLSMHEAERFGRAVLDLAELVWCTPCHDWVSRSGHAIACRAEHLVL